MLYYDIFMVSFYPSILIVTANTTIRLIEIQNIIHSIIAITLHWTKKNILFRSTWHLLKLIRIPDSIDIVEIGILNDSCLTK